MAKSSLGKLRKLAKVISQMKSILIAYSGGVDSSFLLKVARDTLKDNVLAVTAESETYPKEELREAKKFARKIKARQVVIHTEELKNPRFASNPINHCYFCKKELFGKLKKVAKKYNLKFVADASNVDDLKDFRPGRRALREFNVRSPLIEAGLTKKDIRYLSKRLRLSTWNKPNLACLASRFPFGIKITKERLKRVEAAERALKALGLKQLRLRHYNNLARIEVPEADIPKLIGKRSKIVVKLKKLGYNYITVDLEGYRMRRPREIRNFIWKT